MANLNQGDIISTELDGKFYVYKILRIDNVTNIHHVKVFAPLETKPNISDLSDLKTYGEHLPVEGFKDYDLLTNQPVENDELKGFYEYLKLTDFARYVQETGQKIETIVNDANVAFEKGNEQYTLEKFPKAIEYYTKALNYFPLFFEAVDNRALSKMALGELKDAINDFEFSLQINPNSVLAEFGIGECYYKLGDYEKALKSFERAVALDPNDELSQEWLQKAMEMIG